jgi:hypothetical protein
MPPLAATVAGLSAEMRMEWPQMLTLMITIAIIVGIVLIVSIRSATRSAMQIQQQQAQQVGYARLRQVQSPPGKPGSRRASHPQHRQARPPQAPARATRAQAYSPKQVRVVLQRQLGEAYVAEQEQVLLRVRQQEQKVTARLTRPQRLLDFEELKAMHTESRKIADHAYRLMRQARTAEDEIWARIKQAMQERDASGARGAQPGHYKQILDALHEDKDVVHHHRVQYEDEVSQRNQATGRLRDAIRDNCGEKGQEWYRGVKARAEARREGRM